MSAIATNMGVRPNGEKWEGYWGYVTDVVAFEITQEKATEEEALAWPNDFKKLLEFCNISLNVQLLGLSRSFSEVVESLALSFFAEGPML